MTGFTDQLIHKIEDKFTYPRIDGEKAFVYVY